eukprot:6488147-Amphidinium_carterae.1
MRGFVHNLALATNTACHQRAAIVFSVFTGGVQPHAGECGNLARALARREHAKIRTGRIKARDLPYVKSQDRASLGGPQGASGIAPPHRRKLMDLAVL